jgi:rare lipoprotein A
MDFDVLSTQNWSRMFNVWIEDIQVVCHPTTPFDLQRTFLPKVRTLARYISFLVMFFFSLHCTRPHTQASRAALRPAPASPVPEEEAPEVYEEFGQASWYGQGDAFEGRVTASGEICDPSQRTCAHRTLPFGTRLEVRHEITGKRTFVKVTDRGPFIRGRIVDLSRRAAEDLGLHTSGVAPVRIRTVDPEGRALPLPAIDRDNPYTVQVAALSDPANIERLSQELQEAFGPVSLQDVPALSPGGLPVKRVRVGSFLRLEEARKAADRIARFCRDRRLEPFVTRQR